MVKKLDKEKFIEARIEGKTQEEAALAAGAKSKVAAHRAGVRLSHNVTIQTEVEKGLKKYKLTTDKAIDVYHQAMSATKVISATIIYNPGEDPEPKEADSMTKDFIEVPDWGIRLKAADRVLKLRGFGASVPNAKDPVGAAPIEAPPENLNPSLKAAIDRGDIKAIERIVFNDMNKTDTNPSNEPKG